MLTALKRHPFGVKAYFENSLVLTYALPKERLTACIPDCLTLDLFQDKWAFLAIAMVKTRDLRPALFPSSFGSDFFLIGYRIFVRYRNNSGKNLRGLFILKSETDKTRMKLLGSLFTAYSYSTTDISDTIADKVRTIRSIKSRFEVAIDLSASSPALPVNSPFGDWKDARRFAGPLPFTFSYDPHKRQVLIVEGVRQNWTPSPVHVKCQNFSFLKQNNMSDAILSNAFEIRNVPYSWQKGIIEQLQ